MPSPMSVRWEMRTCCSHYLSQTSQKSACDFLVSKDTRYTLHISINQLRKDTQEPDGVVTCKERNWVGGDRGQRTLHRCHWVFICIL